MRILDARRGAGGDGPQHAPRLPAIGRVVRFRGALGEPRHAIAQRDQRSRMPRLIGEAGFEVEDLLEPARLLVIGVALALERLPDVALLRQLLRASPLRGDVTEIVEITAAIDTADGPLREVYEAATT